MSEQTILNLLQLLEALALGWTTLCRLRMTTDETAAVIRNAYAVLFATCLLVAFSPWLMDVPATPMQILLISCFLLIQTATATLWRFGVPRSFGKPT
jgi:hypothetical protein